MAMKKQSKKSSQAEGKRGIKMIIFYVALIASILGNFIMWKFFPMVAPGYTVWTIFVCFVTYMALTCV